MPLIRSAPCKANTDDLARMDDVLPAGSVAGPRYHDMSHIDR